MNITSAKFLKGVDGTNEMFEDGTPQIAFVGRSNVGKSSVINSLTNQKDLARTSSFPGLTKEINIFLINNSFYLVDLPGYGFAKASHEERERLQKLIFWYLFDSNYKQKKVVLILDANVGPTENDLEMLLGLEEHEKEIVIVANKIDKIRESEYKEKLDKLKSLVGEHKIIPYSSETKLGRSELMNEILG